MIARHKKFQIVENKVLENFSLAPNLKRICIGTKGFQKKCKTDVMVVKTFVEEIFSKDMEICQILAAGISCQEK